MLEGFAPCVTAISSGIAPGRIVTVARIFLEPDALVALSVITKEPAAEKRWEASWVVTTGLPSPKFHSHKVALLEQLVKVTVQGAVQLLLEIVKHAVGSAPVVPDPRTTLTVVSCAATSFIAFNVTL